VQLLVIGGSRFIGRAVVQRLLQDGHRVTLLNRGITPDPFGTRVSRVLGDRTDATTLERAVARKSYDAVIDVIAFRGQDTAAAVRLLSGRVGHFVHISSAAVYLTRSGLLPPYREADFAGPVSQRSTGEAAMWLHAQQKRRCEAVLSEAFERSGFPFTAFRLPMVVGPHDYTGRFAAYVQRLLDNGPVILPDGGLNSWGFLWSQDVAEVISSNILNEATFGRSYNLAQREVVSLRRLLEDVAHLLGRRPSLISVPSEWLRRLGLPPSISPYSHDHDILLDTGAALRDLLFQPTPFPVWCERLVKESMTFDDGAAMKLYQTRPAELRLIRELAAVRLGTASPGRAPAFR
jgi:nucleoside-diphosphate-sugar epimerase